MIIWAIVAMIIVGLLLLFLELFVVPGITVAGIGGGLFLLGGVYLAFSTYGSFVGGCILLATITLSLVTLYYAFKSKTWKEVTLQSSIDSKVNTLVLDEVMVGDTAKTISRMRPYGKILINEKYYEAQSIDGLIEQNKSVEVIKISKGKIIVKPLN